MVDATGIQRESFRWPALAWVDWTQANGMAAWQSVKPCVRARLVTISRLW